MDRGERHRPGRLPQQSFQNPWWPPCRHHPSMKRPPPPAERYPNAAPKNESGDGHAIRVFPLGIDGRALRRGNCKPRIGVSRLAARIPASRAAPFLPGQAKMRRWHVGHPFPPDIALRRQRDVGEDRSWPWMDAMQFGLVFTEVPGATPKNPASGLIALQAPVLPGFYPGDIRQPSTPSTL